MNKSLRRIFPRSLPGCLILTVLFCAAVLLICLGYWYWANRPEYIEFDILLPDGQAWTSTEKSEDGHYFIWKRTGQIDLEATTADTIAAYFDGWLTQRGWQRGQAWQCDNFSEAKDLSEVNKGYPTEQGGIMSYGPPDPTSFEKRAACVILRPAAGKLNITLITINPDHWIAGED